MSSGRDHDPTRTRELLADYLRGGMDSEGVLFERHRRALVQKASAHPLMPSLSPLCTPEDLADECLLRILRAGSLTDFEDRGRGSLRTFLGRVLDRVMVDTLRARSARKRAAQIAPLDEDCDEAVDALASPTSSARAQELVDLCRRFLSPRDWELWRLTEVEGCNSQEVAARIGTTPAAVRSRMRHVRARLLEELARRPDST